LGEIAKFRKKINDTEKQCAKEKDNLTKKIQDLTLQLKNLSELAKKQKEELEQIARKSREIEEKLKKEIAEGKLKLKRLKNKIIINMDNKILFPSGSAVLRPEVKAMLRKISEVLVKQQENSFIQVEGHTDNVPIRTIRFRDNWDLSVARAVSVLRELLINPNLDPSRFSAAGYGQFHPIAPNDTPEGRSLNRRVDIVLIPE
ncbi:MAG: endoflagellar motor protein, partial [Candidatus Hydrogenedentota bacterium]